MEQIEDKYYKSKLHTDIKISYTHFQFPVSKEIYNMKEKIQLIRIVPKEDAKIFEMHITLKKQIKQVSSVIERILSIDPGVINIATIASNIPTLRPWIISGKEITSLNERYYLKLKKAYSKLKRIQNKQKSNRISSILETMSLHSSNLHNKS